MSASRVIQRKTCRVCGGSITSAAVAVRAGGPRSKILFFVHKGRCEEIVSDTSALAGKLARVAIDRKFPQLVPTVERAFNKFQRVMRALAEE